MDGAAVSFDLDDTVVYKYNPAQDAEFFAIPDYYDHGNTIAAGDIDPIFDEDSPEAACYSSYPCDRARELEMPSPRSQECVRDTPPDDDEGAGRGAPWHATATTTVVDETTPSDEYAELLLLARADDASWFSSAEPIAASPESTAAPDDDVQWQSVVTTDQETTQDYNDDLGEKLLAYYLSAAYPDPHDVIPMSDPEAYVLRDRAIAAGTSEMPSPRGQKRGRDAPDDDEEEGRTRGAPRHATAGTVDDSPSADNLDETALTVQVWFPLMDQGHLAASSPDWFAAPAEATALDGDDPLFASGLDYIVQ